MADDKLIHVKLEYENAIESKKNILALEINLLKIIKIIKKYHELKSREFELKQKLYQKARTTLTEIRRLEKNLPKLELPEILKEEKPKKVSKKKIQKDNIESQLLEIQNKLNAL